MAFTKQALFQNTDAVTDLQVCSCQLGNNQPIPETASVLKTSTIILSYNQPVLETNKQYRQYCNLGKC